jgi:hypothetical protein
VCLCADHDKNGFNCCSTAFYSGDYLMPGTQLEGWTVEYKTASDAIDTR